MQRLTDLYIAYRLVKKLTTPFNQTAAFKQGIIDDKGNILKSGDELKTPQEKDAWTYIDILTNNIKRMLAKIPGGTNQLFTYAAAFYMLREPTKKLKEAIEWNEETLAEDILGANGDKYITEAIDLEEDAPANAAGFGNIAGIGVGPQGEPGFKARGKFAGHKVYEVDSDTFHKARFGKKKHHRYKSYVGEDEVGQDIRNYGRKNPGQGIILKDPKTGAMIYLKRPGKYSA